jgi:hypothetical protein
VYPVQTKLPSCTKRCALLSKLLEANHKTWLQRWRIPTKVRYKPRLPPNVSAKNQTKADYYADGVYTSI